MKLLEARILEDAIVLPGAVLRVDSFINQQIDTELLEQMADEWVEHFKDKEINKVLTIESSGIAIAYPVARKLNVPLVFAKKAKTLNVGDDVYTAQVRSYTQQTIRTSLVEKRFLNADDNVLLVDDFLANGFAMEGLISICEQAGATPVGICIAIEKGFQEGGKNLRDQGWIVDSLAIIESMDPENNSVTFTDQSSVEPTVNHES